EPIILISRNYNVYFTVDHKLRDLPVNISGSVTDQEGMPLIGVNVQIKGTSQGTATDLDGTFAIEDVDENAILVFSYIGYQTQEVAIKNQSTINVVLQSAGTRL